MSSSQLPCHLCLNLSRPVSEFHGKTILPKVEIFYSILIRHGEILLGKKLKKFIYSSSFREVGEKAAAWLHSLTKLFADFHAPDPRENITVWVSAEFTLMWSPLLPLSESRLSDGMMSPSRDLPLSSLHPKDVTCTRGFSGGACGLSLFVLSYFNGVLSLLIITGFSQESDNGRYSHMNIFILKESFQIPHLFWLCWFL